MKKGEKILSLSRLYLVFLLFSFVGWLWETIHVSFLAGCLVDRGFLLGPICPIYGFTIIIAYFTMGSITNPRGLLSIAKNKWYKYPLCIISAIAIPTLAELIIGIGFDVIFGIRLWDYSHYSVNIFGYQLPLHYKGYIALPISLIWLGLIFVSMSVIVPCLLKLIAKIPPKITKIIALSFAITMVIDIAISSILALIVK